MQTQSYVVAGHTAFTRRFNSSLSSHQHGRYHRSSHNLRTPDPHLDCYHPLLLLPCSSQEKVWEGNLQWDQVHSQKHQRDLAHRYPKLPIAVGILSCLNTGCVQKDCFHSSLFLWLFVCLPFSLWHTHTSYSFSNHENGFCPSTICLFVFVLLLFLTPPLINSSASQFESFVCSVDPVSCLLMAAPPPLSRSTQLSAPTLGSQALFDPWACYHSAANWICIRLQCDTATLQDKED